MTAIAATIAWGASFFVVYVYVGYPIILYIIRRFRRRPVRCEDITPAVTLIISAYNEARVIGTKLENALALDYPVERFEILVVSDASTDGTDSIVESFSGRGIKLLVMPERRGKTIGLNVAMQQAQGEIVIFSDANILYQKDVIRRLMRNFADPSVGCVTGNSCYSENSQSAAHVQENSYWQYEQTIRALESEIGSTVGGDGAIFAIRRDLYSPLSHDAINDLVIPLQIVALGYRAIFEPAAIGFETSAGDFAGEFRRKRRIVNRSWRGVRSVPQVLDPRAVGIFAWQVWSHKVLRWLVLPIVSFAAVGCFVAYPLGLIYRIGAIGFVASLVIAAIGGLVGNGLGRLTRVAHGLFYFYMVNLAAFLGIVMAISGRVEVLWTQSDDETLYILDCSASMKVANLFDSPTHRVVALQAESKNPPLVAHIIHRLAVGGLENGLVNLINATSPDRYRHAIISLTDYTDFRSRIRCADVPVIALYKQKGKDFGTHLRLWHVLRELGPAIVHTRNLPALEFLSVAALAGVRGRIHGEHGRDMYDIDGSSRKYNVLRKALNPFVSRYTAVSNDLAQWLVGTVGVAAEKVVQICNGVDTQRFYPRTDNQSLIGPDGFVQQDTLIVGTVGRMQTVKDQVTLVRSFLDLIQTDPKARERLRLVMIGDGPLREESQKLLRAAGVEALAWLPGERTDIPAIMRAMDLFVLPSIAEGISNTILEAMASGLPVVATRVGGNPELVVQGQTGMLVPPSDPIAMAEVIRSYLNDPDLLARHGKAGRQRAEADFSIDAMVNGYLNVYDSVLNARNHQFHALESLRS